METPKNGGRAQQRRAIRNRLDIMEEFDTCNKSIHKPKHSHVVTDEDGTHIDYRYDLIDSNGAIRALSF